MGRLFLIGAMLTATFLFIWNFEQSSAAHPVAWFAPFVLIILMIINSIWSTRVVSWIIFSAAFFAFMILLSAFTLRWRLEDGFNAYPFYRAIIMYIAFVYVSLAQLKLLGPKPIDPEKMEGKKE